LAGLLGGLVWFLAAFGGALADRMGFRRAGLSLAYLFLTILILPAWLDRIAVARSVRDACLWFVLVTLILMLPALESRS